ncbi:MAG: ferritin-like domain-containing protein, partial [Acidobacteriota bacterium]
MHEKNVVSIDRLDEQGSSVKQFEHKRVIHNLLDASPNRRKLLKTLGMASAMAGAVVALDGRAEAQSSFTDFDILNFALNLEYLEAEFYTVATTSVTLSQLGMKLSGAGVAGPTQGGALVPLTGSALKIAREIASDERTHVILLQNTIKSLGGSPIAKPAINLNALGFGFANTNDFLVLARIFEDIGVTAYAGAAPLI